MFKNTKARKEKIAASTTMRGYIDRLKCLECCGFEDVLKRVAACTSWRCPLWPHRPKKEDEEESENG